VSAVPGYWARMSLATRIVWVVLLLLLVVQAAGFSVVRATVERQARSEIASNLQVGERVWRRLLDQNAQRLREASVVLAADFGFRSAIATGDRETIASALENSGGRIGAGVTALFDPGLLLVSAGGSDGADTINSELLQGVAAGLSQNDSNGRIALINGEPYQFVMVPVRAPRTVGYVLMGFPLTQALVEDLLRLSSVHAAVFATGQHSDRQVSVSTLGQHEAVLLEAATALREEVTLGGDLFAARYMQLDSVGGEVKTLLLRSMTDATAPFLELQWRLGLITVAGLLLFGLGSYMAARRVTQPLQDLTRATESLKQGEFDVDVAGMERGDEVGQLARGFDQMRTSIAAQREEILRLAYWDRLTGLPNRESFRSHLSAAIDGSKSVPKPLVVITLNLDRFKHVNDVLGYAFGDELLKAVASRLKDQVQREGDLVARLGGDEFAILLTRTDAQGALQLTQRITRAFEVPLAFENQTVDISASMGMACWPDHAEGPDELMSRSEIAMHAAKNKTAGVLLYSPALDSASSQNLSLLTDLRQALQQGELRLFLQPKLDTHTGRVVAAEALVRWQHPERGLVPPMQFIPFAEQTGFVRQLTLWMFGEASRIWGSCNRRTAHTCASPSICPPATCSTSNSPPACKPSWPVMGLRPVPSAWRSPRAPSWTTRSAPSPH
jgi:diguanylate cyclase (GGDEF)-like protein